MPVIMAILFIVSYMSCMAQSTFRYDVKMGVDVLASDTAQQALLRGKRIALVANQASRTRELQTSLEVMKSFTFCTIASIMTPEHGFFGVARAGEEVDDGMDSLAMKSYSLYGKNRRPTREMLDGCDVVVYDLQDIGVRSYTYLATLLNVMDACAEYGKPLIVLDRPNPLGGRVVDGNTLDTAVASFVGPAPIPYLHGCTFGEIAQMANSEGWLKSNADGSRRVCSLSVVSMQGWQRWMTWEDTDFLWTPTSPHIPTVNAIRGAAVLGIAGELSLLSIGIGYTLPFQMFGMPTLAAEKFYEAMKRIPTNGMTLEETFFKPFYGKFKDSVCHGFIMQFRPDVRFKPYTMGIEMLLVLRNLHPELFVAERYTSASQSMFNKVTGHPQMFELLFQKQANDEDIRKLVQKGIREFLELRKKYLLYD